MSEDRTLTPANQLVLSHELRHALQDQYADVHAPLPDAVGDFDDRRLAFVSLLEGDATLVMERFLMKRLSGSALGGRRSDMSQLSLADAAGAGRAAGGARPARAALRRRARLRARAAGSGAAGRRSRRPGRAPPASTEQVLHPEKFFAREAPRAVRIRYAPPRGRVLSEGVLGELFTRTFLAAGSEEDAPAAPAGAARASDRGRGRARGRGLGRRHLPGLGRRRQDAARLAHRSGTAREDAREFEQAALRRLERTHGARKRLEGAALFARGGLAHGRGARAETR